MITASLNSITADAKTRSRRAFAQELAERSDLAERNWAAAERYERVRWRLIVELDRAESRRDVA